MGRDEKLNIISWNIKRERIRQHYTVEELADLACLSVETIIKAENSSNEVSFVEYMYIFLALGMINYDAENAVLYKKIAIMQL